MTVTSKVRIYDLAKELKLDTKRLIEEVRREGVDVSVPSNSVSKELAEKIRTKYFPKKETATKRVVKVVKKAARPVGEDVPEAAAEASTAVAEAEVEPIQEEVAAVPSVSAPAPAAKSAPSARVVKKLTPAIRAEQPAPVEPTAEVETVEVVETQPATVADTYQIAEPAAVGTARQTETRSPLPPPPSRHCACRPASAPTIAGARCGSKTSGLLAHTTS